VKQIFSYKNEIMFSFTYISDVCEQKQTILSWIIIFNEDKALIKNLYWYKKYSFWKTLVEFLKINCNRERLGMLLTQIWETCSTVQKHETGRLKHTRTEENVITVDEMVSLLNH